MIDACRVDRFGADITLLNFPSNSSELNIERNFKAGQAQDEKFLVSVFLLRNNFAVLQQCAIG